MFNFVPNVFEIRPPSIVIIPDVDESNTQDKEFKSQDGCGRKGAGSIRIVGGSQIRRHEYPWLCSLRRLGGHICGITLLSVYPRKTILVGAAHCYKKASKT
jgi:hypothetical protein